MSTTTQILFNSPALHSLKRDQLVKLCKIHTLKASGKKKELIERLQLHAKTLPLDDPLSIAARSDNPDAKLATDSEDEASNHSEQVYAPTSVDISRPSEQWEVVMDTIAEVDEETLRSNRGACNRQVSEFGTNTSKTSVTSSLKAIATSLGLKRNTSKSDEATSSSSSLSSKGVVQSSSTLPTSDPNSGFEEPPVEPIPGQSNLRGFPAPSGARLSLSQAPATTTIRLVSNLTTNPAFLLSPPKLQPFATSFDLVPGTPGSTRNSPVPVWPLSPGGGARESLYPAIPTFEESGDLNKPQPRRSVLYDNSDMDIDVDVPGGLALPSIREPTPPKASSARFNTGATPKSTEKPSVEPVDIFSPAPKPQNASIRARLGIPRSEPFVFGSPLPQHNTSNLQFRTAAQSVLDEMNKRLAEEGVEAVDANVLNSRQTTTEEPIEKQDSNDRVRAGDIFDKIHQKEFDRMDSITSHYAAKRGAQSTVAQPILSKKRKSSLVVKERKPGSLAACHRPNGSRVVSGASVKMLPGDFGEEGDEEDEIADRRVSKRPRVEQEESDTPMQPEKPPVASPPDPEEEAQRRREREAIRRKLEHNKAKRRSSVGRPSLGRAPPPKPARLGFFATAKSLVQNVWNRGAGSKAPSNTPVTKSAHPKETKALAKGADAKKAAVIPGSSGAPPLGSHTKRTPSGGSSNSVQSNNPGRSTFAPPVIFGESVASSRPKTSVPLSKPTSSLVGANSRTSTIAGYGQLDNYRGSPPVGFSSLGTKAGLSADMSRASSMGAKSGIRAAADTLQKHTTIIARSRTSSTLMAPTASSLAKTIGHSRIPVPVGSHKENTTLTKASTSSKQQLVGSPQRSVAFEQITNSPQSPAHSVRPGKIFGGSLSPVTPGRPPMSLTAMATGIVGTAAPEDKLKRSGLMGPKTKVLAGRRPRISRSKVIARLASQRAGGVSGPSLGLKGSAGTGPGASTRIGRVGGKVRSSMSTEVAGKKTRQSYAGARGADMLMSAKKRVRQSEHARRRSRVNASDGSRMDVD